MSGELNRESDEAVAYRRVIRREKVLAEGYAEKFTEVPLVLSFDHTSGHFPLTVTNG